MAVLHCETESRQDRWVKYTYTLVVQYICILVHFNPYCTDGPGHNGLLRRPEHCCQYGRGTLV